MRVHYLYMGLSRGPEKNPSLYFCLSVYCVCFVFLPMKDIPINMSHSNVIGIQHFGSVYREFEVWNEERRENRTSICTRTLCIFSEGYSVDCIENQNAYTLMNDDFR